MPEITINFLAVVLAAVAYMFIGMLWYGPLFGAKWKALMGFTDEAMKKMPLTPIQAIIGGFISALVMSMVLANEEFVWAQFFGSSMSEAMFAFNLGFWVWLGFVATTQLNSVLWEGKSWKLFWLNAANTFVAYQAMAFVLTYLQ